MSLILKPELIVSLLGAPALEDIHRRTKNSCHGSTHITIGAGVLTDKWGESLSITIKANDRHRSDTGFTYLVEADKPDTERNLGIYAKHITAFRAELAQPASVEKPAAKKAAVKTTPKAVKAPAKKAPVKKATTAKKPAAKKVPTKTTAAKKVPAKV